jgi:hypothetical protein
MLDILDLFPVDLISAVKSGQKEESADNAKKARAQKVATRLAIRRAKSEAHLAEILPSRYDNGDSWHVISHGDIDSLSYLSHAISGVTHFDHVAISTWCMARPDLNQLAAWLDSGRIDQLDLYVGEIFPNQYGDEYARAKEMAEIYGCRVVVARNHSKVMLMANHAENYYLAAESSANVNTNPRIEQTVITANKDLYDFYCDFFGGLKTIDRSKS